MSYFPYSLNICVQKITPITWSAFKIWISHCQVPKISFQSFFFLSCISKTLQKWNLLLPSHDLELSVYIVLFATYRSVLFLQEHFSDDWAGWLWHWLEAPHYCERRGRGCHGGKCWAGTCKTPWCYTEIETWHPGRTRWSFRCSRFGYCCSINEY